MRYILYFPLEFDSNSRMKLVCFIITLITLPLTHSAVAMPKTVVLIRHAEKPANESNIHLSEKGYARAAMLPRFFVKFDSASAIRLIAQGQKDADSSLRPIETVTPASRQFRQPILHQFVKGESRGMVDYLKSSHAFDGKTVVISWGHDELGAISRMLGDDQGDWSSKVFDRAWVFRYRNDGTLIQVEDIAQEF